jgi:ankyrin repeat protein
VDVNRFSSDGQTPLHDACVSGNLDLVRILVQFGADLQLTNRDGFSVIHLATFSGNSQLLTFLLDR